MKIVNSIGYSILEPLVRDVIESHNFRMSKTPIEVVDIVNFDGEVIYLVIDGLKFVIPIWDIQDTGNKRYLKYSFQFYNGETTKELYTGETTIDLPNK